MSKHLMIEITTLRGTGGLTLVHNNTCMWCSCYLLLALLSLLSHYAESLCMLYHTPVYKVLLLLQHVFLHANALFITSSSGEAWM